MIVYKMKKFTDWSDKSMGTGLVNISYVSIDCQKGITASFDIEVPSSSFYRIDGMMKMFGTMEEIYDFYHKCEKK